MRKAVTLRRLFYGLVAIAFVVLNPIHLPLTLPWLARQWEGNALGAFLARHEGTVLVVSTVYFMTTMTSFYIWLWTKRLRRRAVTQAPAVSANGQRPAAPPYRGPGGGKRAPRTRRRRVRG
ncbi:MAG: hypothetical protein HY688_00255 [Chloroflexi bacterium]|nr:hypothetical protein [Chloroflexota bacterium]